MMSKNCKRLSFTRKDQVKLKTAAKKITDTNNSIKMLMDFVNKMTDTNNSTNTSMDFGNTKMLTAENWLAGNLITQTK